MHTEKSITMNHSNQSSGIGWAVLSAVSGTWAGFNQWMVQLTQIGQFIGVWIGTFGAIIGAMIAWRKWRNGDK